MKTRNAAILTIACLQAYSTTSLADDSDVRTVEVTADSECQLDLLPRTPDTQPKRVYKWTDEQGNVHYSDSVPAEAAERPKEVLNDQDVVTEELEGKSTEALLATYLSIEEIVMHNDRRSELAQAQAQARVMDLYLGNLQRRLACLEAAAQKSEVDESLLQEIRDKIEIIKRYQENIEHYQDDMEHYHDSPESHPSGEEAIRVGRSMITRNESRWGSTST